MSFPSRLQIGILVTAATLIVCSLGVRAELKMAKDSIAAEHRLQKHHAQPAAPSLAVTRDERALNPPPH
jgi:hypothetical protein